MIARVRPVMAASILFGSIVYESASQCGEERVGGNDYFLPLADAAGRERKLNRSSAVRDADALARADVTGERALERLDLATEHEGRRVEHTMYRFINLRLYRAILSL